ncbi:unnamed protein product [Prunus armeniaca]|uniref:Uncharacterized protein n=1 Tax=Prunus armeniaca TaxID=36596 RepID=A0A6J5VB02_PRUAR|nr:unnamed protein product [Prunus armeniaca]
MRVYLGIDAVGSGKQQIIDVVTWPYMIGCLIVLECGRSYRSDGRKSVRNGPRSKLSVSSMKEEYLDDAC